jgi:uncharacterized membrane protein
MTLLSPQWRRYGLMGLMFLKHSLWPAFPVLSAATMRLVSACESLGASPVKHVAHAMSH